MTTKTTYETVFIVVDIFGKTFSGETIAELNAKGFYVVGVIEQVPGGQADMRRRTLPVATLIMEREITEQVS